MNVKPGLLGLVIVGFLFYHCAFAEEEPSFWGSDLSLGAFHQEYESSSADMDSISISPYILVKGWEISTSIPWYHIEGNYFTNGTFPRLLNVCNRLLGLSEARQQRLIRRGRITQTQLNTCQASVDELAEAATSASGIGDLGFYANYGINLTESGSWWGNLGLGYSLDNGDYEKGLGKGSRETSASISLGSTMNHWQTEIMTGYVLVDATDTTEDVNNYAQASFGLGYEFSNEFTLGANYSIEQSYVADQKNISRLTIYGDLTVADRWNIHLYASKYTEVEDYPDTEMGINLGYSFP